MRSKPYIHWLSRLECVKENCRTHVARSRLENCRLTVNHALAHTKRKKGEEGERFVLKGPKTIGSRRTIEIPKVAVDALRRHEQRQQEAKAAASDLWKDLGYVFTTRYGTPIDRGNATTRFQDILEKHKLPKVRFYDLRHTHASLLIAEGVHPKSIAERLGHSFDQAHDGHLRSPLRR